MTLFIKNIDRTCLDEEPLRHLIGKYCKTDKDIEVSFDLRIKDCGSYIYDDKRKRHVIRISPTLHMFEDYIPSAKIISLEGQKYELIATLIHELRHLQQKEQLGRTFSSDKFGKNGKIRDSKVSADYSECEIDARIYENKNVIAAVEYYDELVKKFVR